MPKRRAFLYGTGAVVVLVSPILWLMIDVPTTRADAVPLADIASAADLRAELRSPGPSELAALAERDPMALVRLGRERYDREVRGYRCRLTKQERLGDKLSAVQEIELRFREEPFAVYMLWQKNADGARRALHMKGGEYVDEHGRKLARVEPNGAVARLFVRDVFMPIDGPEARKASRRTIDEAGFRATFKLFEDYNAIATERGVLDLRYQGTGTIGNRPTFVLVRRLPYTPGGVYPDALLIMHLDQEYLLPVAIYSYADAYGKEILGTYEFTQIELNPPFDKDAFKF